MMTKSKESTDYCLWVCGSGCIEHNEHAGDADQGADNVVSDTIRFYEKQGLVRVGRKERRDNNYKEYPEGIVARLLTIKRMKNIEFTLD